MKKELLVASALVSTLGAAGIAEAASATFSGHQKVGITGQDTDSSSTNTKTENQQSSFSVSISETTDAGIKISTGFDLAEESGDGGTTTADSSGLTLTFTDGSSVDLISAGTATGSHDVAVPGAGGEQGITATTANNAPTGLTMGSGSDGIGLEWHSAADAFGVDGLKASISFASNDTARVTGAANTATIENTYSVGVTYVTDAGDSTVTVGGGFASGSHNSAAATKDNEVWQIGITAVTGDLTVGAGYMDGDFINQEAQVNGSFASIGAKYVSGDMTFAVGGSSSEGVDELYGIAGTSAADGRDVVGASVAYTVASGVTATVGFSDISDTNEGKGSNNTSGGAWYVGATVSFQQLVENNLN